MDRGALFDINMGYYSLKSMDPHSSVGYHPEEHAFVHPWSLEASGEEYGYARLKEILPLKDFFSMPNKMVEHILEGVIKGQERRSKEEQDQQRTADRLANEKLAKSGMSPEQIKSMKEAGLLGK